MTYILQDLFFSSLRATQVCVYGEDLQTLVGFSFIIADSSRSSLFLGLCFLHKASSPDCRLQFSEQDRDCNRFSAIHSCTVDYGPFQFVTCLLFCWEQKIRKVPPCLPSIKTARLHLCPGLLLHFWYNKLSLLPLEALPWCTGSPSATYSRALILQWYPPHVIVPSLSTGSFLSTKHKTKILLFFPNHCPVNALFPWYSL